MRSHNGTLLKGLTTHPACRGTEPQPKSCLLNYDGEGSNRRSGKRKSFSGGQTKQSKLLSLFGWFSINLLVPAYARSRIKEDTIVQQCASTQRIVSNNVPSASVECAIKLKKFCTEKISLEPNTICNCSAITKSDLLMELQKLCRQLLSNLFCPLPRQWIDSPMLICSVARKEPGHICGISGEPKDSLSHPDTIKMEFETASLNA